jgi:hypothetical protein
MRAVIAGLLLASLQAVAADTPLRPDDFAYGMTLQDGTGGALYTLELPDEVYRHVTRADLGDLRVFNASGEVVPSQLQQPQTAAEVRQTIGLPFFPLYAEEEKQAGETTLRIVPDKKGALIDLHSRAGEESGKEISHYLLDASALHDPIRRLQLTWDAGDETFVTNVTVEGSDDLSHWRWLANGSLTELLYEGYHLQRSELVLGAVGAKYLRISWPMGDKKVVLRHVVAEVSQPGDESPLHWTTAQVMKGDGVVGHYLFDAGGYYPVERMEVILPQPNSLVTTRLYSSIDASGNRWLQRYQGVIYSLQQSGVTIGSGPINTGHAPHRYWRLDVDQQSGGLGAGQPQIKIGWHPQRLLFVARGNGPFTLAFGSAKAEALPGNNSLQAVLSSLQQGRDANSLVHTIVPQAMHILGGEERLRLPPPPLPWQKWLLWLVLIVGVVAMLLMARSLYRQMSHGKGAA